MKSRSTVAIIGAGLMGHGIGQVFADRGYQVCMYDPDDAVLQSVPERVSDICRQLEVDQGCVDNIELHSRLKTAVECADCVIEAAPEKVALKQDLFAELLKYAPKNAVFATNSSVIPVGTITQKLSDVQAARVVGAHFWNPPYLIPVVEVIQSIRSDNQTVAAVLDILTAAGKKAVHITKDVVIGNRFQHALWREAMAAVDQEICDAETVDTIIKYTIGQRLGVLGPLENADLVGLDMSLDIHNVVLPQLSTNHEPLDVLKAKVKAGELGMKTGRGFYQWSADQINSVKKRLSAHLLSNTRRAAD